MIGMILEFLLLLVAHAAAGIYSFKLKYSKKVTYTVWGAWVVGETGLLFITEFILKNGALQFFVGFILSFIGQYVLFFLMTKGRLGQRIFTILTYSIFFCIAITFFLLIKGTFLEMHQVFILLIDAAILLAVVGYFICYVCPLCYSASSSITTGWIQLILMNIVFLIMVILSSMFPVRVRSFHDSRSFAFVLISVSIMAMYPVVFTCVNNMAEVAGKREVEAQNRILRAQIEMETVQLAADSQARHDRRHHNLVMLEFANTNDVDSIREYLKNLVDIDGEIWGETRHCENVTVNTVLCVYERRASENGIPVKFAVKASREIPVLPQDLVIIIANLFENAIHAVAKLKNREGYINININETEQQDIVNNNRGSAFMIIGPLSRANASIVASDYVQRLFESRQVD